MGSRTREEVLALANPDPEFSAIWGKFPLPEFDFTNPEKVLKLFRDTSSFPIPPPIPEVTESTLTFTTPDDHELRLLVYKPASAPTTPLPLVVLYHGGGGAIGNPESNAPLCRDLVKQFDAICISPQYRLAPEDPWPIGHNDCWYELKWVAANAETLGATPSAGFIIGGISNGSTVCGVLMHRARDEKLSPPLTGVFLAAGSVVTPVSVPEKYKDRYLARFQDACLDAPILDRPTKKFFDECMRYDPHSPMFASLLWPTGHQGLPRTYFQACGMDINRDDSLIMEQVLREECGSPTRIDVYPGLPHCFWGILPMLAQSKKWQVDTMKGFTWLFGNEIEGKL